MTEAINKAVQHTTFVCPEVDILLGVAAAFVFVWVVNRILE